MKVTKNRIREVRQAKGFSLEYLADKLDVSRTTVANYERGDTEPKIEKWQKIANVLGVSVSYLQGFSVREDGEDERAYMLLNITPKELSDRLGRMYHHPDIKTASPDDIQGVILDRDTKLFDQKSADDELKGDYISVAFDFMALTLKTLEKMWVESPDKSENKRADFDFAYESVFMAFKELQKTPQKNAPKH
ncbi:helix-turn-helix domain-containing protein [Lacticaseibacillus pantheris]|uniref:helix-turn-helix domain-containing protein n=1 Tax=Lacticaseibacillus pantheris TaxID=171523 RepID=UPI0009E6FAAE|nr:helix-turn-helix transcriptional regulator [Lacticaseibacillus pantheris]